MQMVLIHMAQCHYLTEVLNLVVKKTANKNCIWYLQFAHTSCKYKTNVVERSYLCYM